MATQSIRSDELSVRGNQVDTFDVEPLPRNIWFKESCVSCNRHDVPFEQRGWVVCLKCTIDTRQFQIEGAFNPKNRKQTPTQVQKMLDNYLELLQIFKFSEMWKQVLSIESHGLVTIQYDGKPEPRNFSGLKLTGKGKEVLGRADEALTAVKPSSPDSPLQPSKSPKPKPKGQ